jgi:Mg2+-importing ATPase
MLYFGPFGSVLDFATFAIMALAFHSGPERFRSG